MGTPDEKLAKLLRVGRVDEIANLEMPFAFDTRVVAQWRGQASARAPLSSLMRRVTAGAACTAAVFSVAAYLQFRTNDSLAEPLSNSYAIADSAIQSVTAQ